MLVANKEQKPKHQRIRGNYKNTTWGILGFVSADKGEGDSKKYRALCLHCNKYQSNTSIDRLIIHRKSCPKYKADLTEKLSNLTKSKKETSAEPASPPAPAPISETNDPISVNLLDKLLVEDDSDRNAGSTLVGYLNDLDQLATFPASDANRLQKDLLKAETDYLEAKSEYFTKMNEISELKRTVTMLEAKKTQLEIVKLRAECE
ncbi:uncharacterized protein Dana_GF18423 [Drosophila ananassae]|uniref:Uncharacterized protein n=1 Tax=Drosophila ananassae TaxID=7217 RepID=B3M1L5_DROAN|nr:uncharacterized protein LOC6501197 [Drosophila ananassae]EDV43306.1 uncharacterized protein Dana_GF18423 [Drosophila ananassae]